MARFRSRSRRLAVVGYAVVAVTAVTVAVVAVLGSSGPAKLTPSPSSSSPPAVTPAMAGVSPEAQIQYLSGPALTTSLNTMAASGAKWVRIDLFWPNIEPASGTFDWSLAQPVITGAIQRGLQVLAVPDYDPPWVNDGNRPAAYAAFVRAAAVHYAPLGVHAWEIWNEPNLAPTWGPTADAAAYTAMLKPAYSAIKAVDPVAVVVAGALAPASDAANGSEISPTTFVTRMYRAGAAGYFDALSVHPSSYPDMPANPDSWNAFEQLPGLHALMAAHGDGAKRIWLTEYGAPTGTAGDAVTPNLQAAMITQAFATAAAWPWAGPVFSYWQDQANNLAYDQDNFGIISYNGSKKLAYAAFLTAAITPNPPVPANGFRIINRLGVAYAYGGSPALGSAPTGLVKPIVGMAATPDGRGYWMVASDGGVFAFGDAHFYGSTGAIHLTQPIVGMAATPDGKGYWMVASDGGVFSFGDAHFYGSTGAIHLTRPIVGMATASAGQGYWMVASDGGVFAFGDAHFYGSTGGIHLVQPIVGMAATPDARGYRMVASDGGVFSFGDAHFYGSTGGIHLVQPIVGMAATPDGRGYWMVASDGGVFAFGDAPFSGSAAGKTTSPVVAVNAVRG